MLKSEYPEEEDSNFLGKRFQLFDSSNSSRQAKPTQQLFEPQAPCYTGGYYPTTAAFIKQEDSPPYYEQLYDSQIMLPPNVENMMRQGNFYHR